MTVRDQAQIGECILDFGALEKAQAAVDLVGDPRREKHFFEDARLGVGAIKDGELTAIATAGHPVFDALQHEFGFVTFVEGSVELDRVAAFAARPKIFTESPAVVGDQRVGGIEDGAGGAIVLLEAHQFGMRKITPEGLQIFDTCTAPAVNRLVVVADDEWRTLGAGEQFGPAILNGVGVLKLVDQHVPKAAPIVAEQLGVIAPEFEGTQQQFGEIDHAGALTGFFVVLVELDELPARGVVAVLERLRPQSLVFVVVDEVLDVARYPARVIESLRLEDFFDHP